MQGRRFDGPRSEYQPGDFGKGSVKQYGVSFDAWWVCTPNGLLGRLSMPEDVRLGEMAESHHVEEHEDGQQPGNSNSIKVEGWPLGSTENRAPRLGRHTNTTDESAYVGRKKETRWIARRG